MIIADIPVLEAFRLVDLSSYDIMDSPPENDFDELVELAAQICNCPISMISLLDKDRQWFKSKIGFDESQTPRDVSFCSHAILQDDVMIVEDATVDPRFIDNPLVTGNAKVRFYAGAPIVSPAGHKLGTLCIIDHAPRKLSEKEERALTILSNQVTKLLELRKKNFLIRNRAKEIITLKSKAISNIINKQELEKKLIATDMHEDLAQGIASSIFYLQAAEDNKDRSMSLMQTAKGQLQDILVRMQNLSYSITPQVIDLVPARDLVFEYVEKIAGTFPFFIALESVGSKNTGSSENALGAIRIIEQWLTSLAAKKDVLKVKVIIQQNENFELLIEDNGCCNFETFKKEIVDSLVYERANAHGGFVECSVSTTRNVLKVSLPVSTMAA